MAGLVKLQRGITATDERLVWMAPALQVFFVIATVSRYSRVSGLFAWRCHWP
jgi:hypothetical protein